jgi:hypothetical protein
MSKFFEGCGLSATLELDVRRVQESKADVLWLLKDLAGGAARLVAELEDARASTAASSALASWEVEAIPAIAKEPLLQEQRSAAENVRWAGRKNADPWPPPSISSYAMTCPQTCQESLRQVMQHWNVSRNSKSCCPLHQSVAFAITLLKQLAKDPCEPLWSPHLGWQCGVDCNALNHQDALRCRVCNSSIRWDEMTKLACSLTDGSSSESAEWYEWSSDYDDEHLEPQGQAHAEAPEQNQQEVEHQKNKVSL